MIHYGDIMIKTIIKQYRKSCYFRLYDDLIDVSDYDDVYDDTNYDDDDEYREGVILDICDSSRNMIDGNYALLGLYYGGLILYEYLGSTPTTPRLEFSSRRSVCIKGVDEI